jgi:hypothetical protein
MAGFTFRYTKHVCLRFLSPDSRAAARAIAYRSKAALSERWREGSGFQIMPSHKQDQGDLKSTDEE